MKRISFLAAVSAVVFSISSVFAAPAVLNISTDYSEKTTTVSAFVGEKYAGRRVNIIILNPGFTYDDLKNKNEAAVNWAQQAYVNDEGSFTSDMMLTPSANADEINYIAVAALDGLDDVLTKTFELYNQSFADRISDDIKTAIKNGDDEKIISVMENYAGLLGIEDVEQYNVFSNYTQELKKRAAQGIIKEAPNGASGFEKAFCTCVSAIELDKITDNKAYETALKPLIADAKDSVKNEFENMKDKEELIAYLMSNEFNSSIDIIGALNEKLVLGSINSSEIWTEIAASFIKYADILGIDVSSYNSLNDKKTPMQKLIGKGYTTEKAAAEAFDNAVAAQKKDEEENQNTGSATGNSGSKGSKGGSITAPSIIPVLPENTENKTLFDDLEEVEWAKDDINYLAEKGIINGVGEKIFAPQKNITRAEFTKLICNAFGIKFDNAALGFSDVSKDDWYYESVCAAYAAGFIKGAADGRFLPNEIITREDIAVILGRYLMKDGAQSGENTAFSDREDISDYALSSVAYLSESKIINGYSDGTFRPKESATRAETAVLIAKILKQKGVE